MAVETIERDLDLTEIINGEEILGPSPFLRHQYVVLNLTYIIHHYVKKNDLGRLHISPLDVIFEEGVNRLQPDILFIKKENSHIGQDWVRGVPDMVCEVISSGSYEKDTEVKKAIYEKYKVPEYWIVMPELQTIEILTIEGDKYKLHSFAALEGVVKSKIIEGLAVNVNDIFE
ncbi:Uma2 family endonuclease [Candidatus Magnetomonas plexicatena]|uniref:Uma2 family endonuclease n=1 Tax=Candidatus Magnetomonas plexicatena TaxID=2552947 RepID=UPI0011056D3D|nr:Uma2 family endonuclease [Nitrospirales bacterium LBB_01]